METDENDTPLDAQPRLSEDMTSLASIQVPTISTDILHFPQNLSPPSHLLVILLSTVRYIAIRLPRAALALLAQLRLRTAKKDVLLCAQVRFRRWLRSSESIQMYPLALHHCCHTALFQLSLKLSPPDLIFVNTLRATGSSIPIQLPRPALASLYEVRSDAASMPCIEAWDLVRC